MNKMKKLFAVIISVCTVAAAIPSSVAFADGQKVVTLGADLSEEQQQMILNYFGITGEDVETLTITNEDEREHLGAYVPLEQIGTKTFSCAYVNPTSSGGIQVKTANLTWVTSNMIASTLSTSGVVNCDVLAASPFAVSGTGALTGVIMAYESASGETLDDEKKDVANQELVTTATIGDHIGAPEATLVVNEAKEEVIEGDVEDAEEINNIVNNITVENDITLSEDDTDLLVSLLAQIGQLDYDIDDMKETLNRVEDNVTAQIDGTAETDSDSGTVEEDSILKNTDDSALGDDVTIDATDPTAVEQTEAASGDTEVQTEDGTGEQPETEEDAGFQIVVSDTYNSDEDSSEGDALPSEGEETEAAAEPEEAPETEAAAEPETEAAEEPETTAETEGTAELSPDDDLSSVNLDNTDDTGASESGSEDTGLDDNAVPEGEGEIIDTTEESSDEGAEEGEGESSLSVYDLTLSPEYTVSPGLNVLTVTADQEGVSAGSGTITVYTSDGSAVDTVSMDDASAVAENGNEFDIYLSSPLAAGSSYYVVFSEDALEENGTAMPATDGSDWTFDTTSSGVSVMQNINGLNAGSAADGNLYIDLSSAGYAVIDSVTIDGADVTELTMLSQSDFTDSAGFQITFPQAGQASIHVTYYDSPDSMNYVEEASCTVSVW